MHALQQGGTRVAIRLQTCGCELVDAVPYARCRRRRFVPHGLHLAVHHGVEADEVWGWPLLLHPLHQNFRGSAGALPRVALQEDVARDGVHELAVHLHDLLCCAKRAAGDAQAKHVVQKKDIGTRVGLPASQHEVGCALPVVALREEAHHGHVHFQRSRARLPKLGEEVERLRGVLTGRRRVEQADVRSGIWKAAVLPHDVVEPQGVDVAVHAGEDLQDRGVELRTAHEAGAAHVAQHAVDPVAVPLGDHGCLRGRLLATGQARGLLQAAVDEADVESASGHLVNDVLPQINHLQTGEVIVSSQNLGWRVALAHEAQDQLLHLRSMVRAAGQTSHHSAVVGLGHTALR
mmetsp:Transcript_34886/g.81571  ORF Transcript_34886/g.81571 Transcript_34886/m.81571 type:complete len:348 (+) Transcript_34886:1522-2565(+)